jgi:excisionase family DNA binding protein
MRKATVRQPPVAPRLWSVSDVSEFLGIPVGTPYRWRHPGQGPRARKVGRHLRYDPADVQAWLDEAA